MSLALRLKGDATQAFKDGNHTASATLRYLLAQVQERSIAKRAGGTGELTDEEVMEVLKKEVKRRRESITLFTKGNRPDLVGKEQEELEILQGYLPPTLDISVIEKTVDDVIARKGSADFPSIMRDVMAALKGQADGSVVAGVVKQKLAEHAR